MQTINTLQDAQVWFSNSGVANWEWFDGFDKSALIEFAYRNANEFTTDDGFDSDALIAAYLRSVGQDPAEYSL